MAIEYHSAAQRNNDQISMYKIIAPNGAVHSPPPGRCWSLTEQRIQEAGTVQDGFCLGQTVMGVPRVDPILVRGRRSSSMDLVAT